jgi:hypothetical protein
LIVENARLNGLLDNRDDVLRKTNKEKREYRSLLGEAKENVVKLESLLDDAMAQIVKRPWIFGEENPSPCTFAIVPGSVAIAYRSHHSR